MADAIAHPEQHTFERHQTSRQRRRRDDLLVATTALIAAMLALPLAQNSWHGPEVAATLAVSATALLAGQRWAVALIVMAELMLVPTMWPRAFLGAPDLAARLVAMGSMLAIVPGMLSMRRAAAALVLVTGRQRTQATCRQFHTALVVSGVLATLLPLF